MYHPAAQRSSPFETKASFSAAMRQRQTHVEVRSREIIFSLVVSFGLRLLVAPISKVVGSLSAKIGPGTSGGEPLAKGRFDLFATWDNDRYFERSIASYSRARNPLKTDNGCRRFAI
jgi:hypothetical protein